MIASRWVSVVACSLVVVGIALCNSSCNNMGKLATNSKRSGGLWSIKVTSPAFRDGEAIPAKYTVDGENLSPPISWTKGPNQTKEYAIIMEDPDAKGKMPATHWLVYRVPASVNSLPEGASRDAKLVQGKNYLGMTRYAGPNPPKGSSKPHRYYIEVFALSDPVNTAPGADRQTVAHDFRGFVLGKGQMVGTYQH
jgi:Raf kinase inhibitor-like YbhB/YbcL family protein